MPSIEPRQEMLARANGRTTFPQIFIGTTHVGGCDDLYALENQGRLDTLLKTGELVEDYDMSSFRAAAIQMRSGVDPQRNAADLAGYVADAVGKGAVYVQTPEMTGALQRDRKSLQNVLKAESDDVIVRTASELAAKNGIHLHIGSTAIARDDGKIANRAFLFGPDGSILTRYDKIHMFDVDLDNGESWREFGCLRAGRRYGRDRSAVCTARICHLL